MPSSYYSTSTKSRSGHHRSIPSDYADSRAYSRPSPVRDGHYNDGKDTARTSKSDGHSSRSTRTVYRLSEFPSLRSPVSKSHKEAMPTIYDADERVADNGRWNREESERQRPTSSFDTRYGEKQNSEKLRVYGSPKVSSRPGDNARSSEASTAWREKILSPDMPAYRYLYGGKDKQDSQTDFQTRRDRMYDQASRLRSDYGPDRDDHLDSPEAFMAIPDTYKPRKVKRTSDFA